MKGIHYMYLSEMFTRELKAAVTKSRPFFLVTAYVYLHD